MAAMTTTNGKASQPDVPPKSFGKIVLDISNSVIPLERLTPTPSGLNGLSEEAELQIRSLGCDLIQLAGKLLRLPQVAMATGCILFHRFFYAKSFVRHPFDIVAMASLGLACKIEECPRRPRDIINVFRHIKQVRSGKPIEPMMLDANYVELKNKVINAERRVLKELGFCVHVKHPHKLIFMYLKWLDFKLEISSDQDEHDEEKSKDLKVLQMSWREQTQLTESGVSEIDLTRLPTTIGPILVTSHPNVLLIPAVNNARAINAYFLIFNPLNERRTIQKDLFSPKENRVSFVSNWNFMNDSLRTDVFVRYPPETIAAACIYLSARKLSVPLPKNPSWFQVLGVEEDDIKECCYKMICLYNRQKPNQLELEELVASLYRKLEETRRLERGGKPSNKRENAQGKASNASSPQRLTSGNNSKSGTPTNNGNNNENQALNTKPTSRSRSRSPSSRKRRKHHKRSRSRSSSYETEYRGRDYNSKKRSSGKSKNNSRSRSRSVSPYNRKSSKKGHKDKSRDRYNNQYLRDKNGSKYHHDRHSKKRRDDYYRR